MLGQVMLELFLAQTQIIARPLPGAPGLVHYTLEQLEPVIIVLALLGGVILYTLNRRSQLARGLMVAGGFWIAAVGVLAAGLAVETPRELLTKQTRALIEHAIDGDPAAAGRLLANDLSVTTLSPDGFAMTKDRFLRVIEGMALLGIQTWSAKPRGASIDGPNVGRVDYFVRVATRGGMYSGLTPSVWRFTWRQEPDRSWKLRRLEMLSMYGQPVDADALRWATRLAN